MTLLQLYMLRPSPSVPCQAIYKDHRKLFSQVPRVLNLRSGVPTRGRLVLRQLFSILSYCICWG